MSDLNFQNLSTVQNNTQPMPVTIASTTTIAPTTFLTFVSGTAAIATVTPPVTGQHMIIIIPTGAFTMTTAGNLKTACTAVASVPVVLLYNPLEQKYYAGELPIAA